MSIAGDIAAFARPLIRLRHGGIGCILCLHRVIPAGECSRLGDNRAIELSPDALRAALQWLISRGIEPVRMDDVPGRLQRPREPKFFAVTLDDGYRDNLTHALPVFRELSVPFTVTLTTGFLNGSASPWWYWIEEILLSRRSLSFAWEGENLEFQLHSPAQQENAFAALARMLRAGTNEHRDALLSALASAASSAGARASVPLLSWDEARALASDPLVTIGCHTVTHPVLRLLDENEARRELTEARDEIERRTGVRPAHLAFTFGGSNAAGEREFRLAGGCGFTTAMTTRCANLFPAHAQRLTALPRLSLSGNYPPVARMAALESGLVALREFGWRRVICE